MKIGLDIRIVTDATGKRGLRVWPEVEGTERARTYAAAILATILLIGVLWITSEVPDPEIKPSVTIMGGY